MGSGGVYGRPCRSTQAANMQYERGFLLEQNLNLDKG